MKPEAGMGVKANESMNAWAANNHQKLRDTWNRFSLRTSRENQPSQQLGSRVLASRIVGERNAIV